MSGQQVVIELVDLGPLVDGLVVLDLHRSEKVVEDGVKADVAKAKFLRRDLELRLAILPNEGARKIGAHREIEEAIYRAGDFIEIRDNGPCGKLLCGRLFRGKRG